MPEYERCFASVVHSDRHGMGEHISKDVDAQCCRQYGTEWIDGARCAWMRRWPKSTVLA